MQERGLVVSWLFDDSSGKSKGFGFVEMDDSTEGKSAVDALNGNEIDGRCGESSK